MFITFWLLETYFQTKTFHLNSKLSMKTHQQQKNQLSQPVFDKTGLSCSIGLEGKTRGDFFQRIIVLRSEIWWNDCEINELFKLLNGNYFLLVINWTFRSERHWWKRLFELWAETWVLSLLFWHSKIVVRLLITLFFKFMEFKWNSVFRHEHF